MALPSQREVEDVIIDLLSEDAGVNPADMRQQLEDLGAALPLDSILAVEVLVRVETLFGVKIPTDPNTAEAMQSVAAFAAVVREAVVESTSKADA